jgi:hypothetical protein
MKTAALRLNQKKVRQRRVKAAVSINGASGYGTTLVHTAEQPSFGIAIIDYNMRSC